MGGAGGRPAVVRAVGSGTGTAAAVPAGPHRPAPVGILQLGATFHINTTIRVSLPPSMSSTGSEDCRNIVDWGPSLSPATLAGDQAGRLISLETARPPALFRDFRLGKSDLPLPPDRCRVFIRPHDGCRRPVTGRAHTPSARIPGPDPGSSGQIGVIACSQNLYSSVHARRRGTCDPLPPGGRGSRGVRDPIGGRVARVGRRSAIGGRVARGRASLGDRGRSEVGGCAAAEVYAVGAESPTTGISPASSWCRSPRPRMRMVRTVIPRVAPVARLTWTLSSPSGLQ